ncbi:MAG TPA: PDZ domain-containing protein [Coriobacteriia bacterium]
MTFWKTTVLTAALVVACAAGAAFGPAVRGQEVRVAPVPAPAQHSSVMQMLRGGSEIGVTIRDLSNEETTGAKAPIRAGAVIASVRDDGAAAAAGMKNGDIVVEFDGERIRSARQFARVVEETPVGRRVDAAVLRDGQRMTLTVQPREARGGYRLLSDMAPRLQELERNLRYVVPSIPAPPALPSRPVIPDIERVFSTWTNRLGISVDELSSQLANYFGTKDGVLVTAVTDDSVAAKAGLKAGDVITSFNNEPVTSASELRRRIQRLDEGAEFTIGVVRDKKTMTLKGKFEARPERVRTYIS